MKVNVTMFKKVPGAEKPILDYISFRARNWNGALLKAMKQFHVTGKESSGGYLPILDIDGEFIIGQFREVTGDDQAEARRNLIQLRNEEQAAIEKSYGWQKQIDDVRRRSGQPVSASARGTAAGPDRPTGSGSVPARRLSAVLRQNCSRPSS